MEFSQAYGDLDFRTATTDDILALRDRIVTNAAALIDASRLEEAIDILRRLEFVTIDEKTLELTDPFLFRITGDRKVVATCDVSRAPAADEIVVVYGNYPHMFANVVVNNPIKRHVLDYWKFRHSQVEYDRRWDGVERIYIINVDERIDRYDSVLRELASASAPFDRITRVAAFKPELAGAPAHVVGPIACLRSHIEALRRAQAAHAAHALILEDDFCFTSDLDQHLTDLRLFFERRYDYSVCLIATSKYGPIIPKDDLLSLSYQRCTNTGGYLVSRDGVSRLLPIFEHALDQLKTTADATSHAADRCWAVLQPSGTFLAFRRKFGFQVSSFSDIEGSISRYLD